MSDADPAGSKPGSEGGLRLAPFRGLRPAVDAQRVGALLCPPYDVIGDELRSELLATDPDNAVAVILPEQTAAGYAKAAERLTDLERRGVYRLDDAPAVYVYEMQTPEGSTTRGLLGAVELRDPAAGVILPHEDTMADPVADRLELMTATGADLEPIYLVYDGGGPASAVVREVDTTAPAADTTTPDGVRHRLWRIEDPAVWKAIDDDLSRRHALIADGHHRYATYRERQRRQRDAQGAGPWDRGLTLLVDSTDHGPQVHAIHRVVPSLALADALAPLDGLAVTEAVEIEDGLAAAERHTSFAAVLSDGHRAVLVTDADGRLRSAAERPGELPALAALDVSVVHHGLVERIWGLTDDVDTVRYAHSVEDALELARSSGGTAILLRPTPVTAVAAVAAQGGRMPRKSTLFTPKPASGLVMRRLSDDVD